ncbi:hypothetical protein OOT00_10370 [Desulfobotulus sp. H1]|uniref:BFD-like (2Fe-2S) protein n=1 Tax=Desulfobotulus pelophilus TaxID=2823377 RepID=A0ABT3NA97_9BACT|nr:hypothetical protein [Desulfobotulus pelophilus]MCW7754389.1 hypothetical protein [Desulfobotulus pelophilus]
MNFRFFSKPAFGDEDLVCHCFAYTRRHIEEEYALHGRSLIYEKILREKQSGGCDCASKNPLGR